MPKQNVSPHLREKKKAYIEGLTDALEGMLFQEDLVKGIAALRKKIRDERNALIKMG